MAIEQLSYSAAEIDERLGRVSGDNLLINPFFQINQRGQSSYSGTGYGFDGWRGTRSTSVIEINADGSVTVSGAIKEDGILQKLESAYAGQTLTTSVEVTSITGTGQLYVRNATTWATFGYTILENSGLHVLTVTIPPDNTDPIAIYMDFSPSATEANSMTIAPPIKIEKGEISTQKSDALPAPNFGFEECRRYLVALREITTGGNACHAFGAAISSTEIRLTVPLSRPMRIQPTLIVNDLSKWTIRHGNASLPITNLELLRSSSNFLLLRATTSGATAGYACYLQNADPSALILLSAEL